MLQEGISKGDRQGVFTVAFMEGDWLFCQCIDCGTVVSIPKADWESGRVGAYNRRCWHYKKRRGCFTLAGGTYLDGSYDDSSESSDAYIVRCECGEEQEIPVDSWDGFAAIRECPHKDMGGYTFAEVWPNGGNPVVHARCSCGLWEVFSYQAWMEAGEERRRDKASGEDGVCKHGAKNRELGCFKLVAPYGDEPGEITLRCECGRMSVNARVEDWRADRLGMLRECPHGQRKEGYEFKAYNFGRVYVMDDEGVSYKMKIGEWISGDFTGIQKI